MQNDGGPLGSTSAGSDSPSGASRWSATSSLAGADWPARAADTIEDVVDALHDRLVRPVVLAARAVVFGILVLAMALVVSVLGSIAAVRVLDSYRYPFGHRVWAAEALVGGLATVVGIVAWAFRRPRRAGDR